MYQNFQQTSIRILNISSTRSRCIIKPIVLTCRKILDKELKLKQDRIRKEQELKEALDKKIFQKSRADQNFDIKEEIKQKQYRKEMDFKYRQYLEEQVSYKIGYLF